VSTQLRSALEVRSRCLSHLTFRAPHATRPDFLTWSWWAFFALNVVCNSVFTFHSSEKYFWNQFTLGQPIVCLFPYCRLNILDSSLGEFSRLVPSALPAAHTCIWTWWFVGSLMRQTYHGLVVVLSRHSRSRGEPGFEAIRGRVHKQRIFNIQLSSRTSVGTFVCSAASSRNCWAEASMKKNRIRLLYYTGSKRMVRVRKFVFPFRTRDLNDFKFTRSRPTLKLEKIRTCGDFFLCVSPETHGPPAGWREWLQVEQIWIWSKGWAF